MGEIRMQDSETLELYFRDLASLKPLSREEEVELASRILKGSQAAREKLISSNLRFVVSIAMKYQNRGVSLEDLVSAGNRGLVTAADRFDGNRGFKFISYAVWWVRQAIQVSLADDNRTIRLPANRVDLRNRISKVLRNWRQHNGSDPEPEDIAEALGVSVEMIKDTLMQAQEVQSLDATFRGDNEGSLLNVLADQAQALPDTDAIENSVREQVMKVLNTLSPREAEIIRLYFGMEEGKPLTLEEIGRRFNVTRERVRQIKEKALRRLQHPTRRGQLESLWDRREGI